MSVASRIAQNVWLLRICRDRQTFSALKGSLEANQANGKFGRLRIRGLDGPVLFRPAATDVRVFWELFRRREYQFVDGWPFKTVVDCGANVGMFMAWALHASAGRITRYVGVEPDVDSFQLLEEQVRSQHFADRAVLMHAAAWGRDGAVSFEDQGPSWSHRVIESGGGTVRAMTVGSILDEAGLESCDLLKLDIEGGERQVLQDLHAYAKRVNVVVAELHSGLDYPWFARTVAAADFIPAPAGKLFRTHPGAVRRGSPFDVGGVRTNVQFD